MPRDIRLVQCDSPSNAMANDALRARRKRAIAAGELAPDPEPVRPLADWRTSEERASDQALPGTWWRCRSHGPTRDAIVVGTVAYCPADDCTERVLLARSASRDGVTPWDKPREVQGPEMGPRFGKRPRRSEEADPVVAVEPFSDAAREYAQAMESLSDEDQDESEAYENEVQARQDEAAACPNRGTNVPGIIPTTAEEETMAKAEKGGITETLLAALAGGEKTRQELTAAVAKARPDLGDRAPQNTSAALTRLRISGRIERTITGWRMTTAASTGAEEVLGDEETPAEAPKARKPRAAKQKKARGATPAAAAPAAEVDVPPRGATASVSPATGGPAWTCVVCRETRPGSVTRLVLHDMAAQVCGLAVVVQVAVCACCAADGDVETRAAAAPLLRDELRRRSA